MMLLWRISSRAALAAALITAAPLLAQSFSGRVELSDSRDPAVRKRMDYSGVVISLKSVDGAPIPVRASKATMIQKDKTFSPHVLAITVGTSVAFPNYDPIFHNAFSSYSGQVFDVGLYPPGSSRSVRFMREGLVRVFCNIHSSMSAVIDVLATPYFATTPRDGSFSIPNVPAGDYQLSVFHERASEAVVQALERRITVPRSGLTLPPIVISEAGYLPIPHMNKHGQAYAPETDSGGFYGGRK
jgi:plastocyanin